jgi:hypothetical protein
VDPRSQATKVLHQAEGELRNLLLRSAELGDYETARVLAEWAKQLKQMLERNGEADGQTTARPEEDASNTANRECTRTSKRAARKTRRNGARGEYPKFLRDGEELLKIGWSKRTWATYRHKTSKRVLYLVARALLAAR